MWILPSQLSKCAPDMAALDLESKTSLASDCEPSHIVSLRGSLKLISSVKWKKDSWMQHLFGAILKPSHTNLFTDWWISSLRDTLVSHSLPLESEPEKKTQDTCGLGLQTEFDFFSQQCAFLKMSKDISRWDSPQSSVIWKNWVTKCRGEYSLRVKSAHLTNANDFSSWPTAAARDYKGESGAGRQERKGNPADTLPNAVAQWPTPSCGECLDQGTNWETLARLDKGGRILRRIATLHGQAAPANPSTLGSRQESWATPQASDHVEGARTEVESNQKCLGRDLNALKTNGRLNSRWVEMLMNLPLGWTCPSCPASVIKNWPRFVTGWLRLNHAQMNSDCLEMESFQQQQPELF